jgi:hypothetical protein
MKQLIIESEQDSDVAITTEETSDTNQITSTEITSFENVIAKGADPKIATDTGGINESNSTLKRGSALKVKSSRRASFQLSNTVKNIAKQSGVDHLIGIVSDEDGGERKKGMREQINDLKDEIEKKGMHI